MPEESKTPANESPSAQPTDPKPAADVHPKRRWLRVVAALVVVLLIVCIGVPRFLHSLHTISTDDAYVNSYATFVAPRVMGQVARVFVEDNNRVKKGDVLVELDPEPFQVQVAIKQAAVDAARADLVVADATVRGQIGQVRGLRFKLVHAIEDVDNQIALVRARAATWEQSKATLVLAEAEFERSKKLLATKVVSAEEFDQKREALDVAKAQVTQALESVYQARTALGLTGKPPEGKPLTDVPADLDQTFSSVRQATAELMHGAAQLGVVPSSFDLTPRQVVEEFYKRDPGGDIDRIYAEIIKKAPGLKQAEAGLLRAERDLDQAKLDLRYCGIAAEIDGVITRRNVNPGNNVQVGQSLMVIRSLRDIWVDANFKETQLRDLRIGQRVELGTDMYGSKRIFEGRISGFTMGTGSTLSILPAQNATGNFVKVVQRLPVRIDLVNYEPDKVPLFVGLSVEPVVDLKTAPSGPSAGRFLQESTQAPAAKP
ncbi:MAG: HlyD family secretion protein [Chthoniobacteraceae bacterium]|nr:HlyD family secretion protein [Chthoniobacteraceae bacterium]